MKLYYSHNLNPRVAVAVAKYLRSPVEFVRASPRDPLTEEQFRPINPNALVPVLVEDGRSLWETDAIACRLSTLARCDFFPTDRRLPDVLKWVSWSTQHFTMAASTFYWQNIIRPRYLGESPDPLALAAAEPDLHRYAQVLNDILASCEWLVGNCLTYADFRVATALPFAEAAALPLEAYTHIWSWHDRLNTLDAWNDPFAGLA